MSSGQEVGDIFGAGAGFATALLRSPVVIIASIGFWGMNISLFRRIGIDYVRVLLHDMKKERKEKAAILALSRRRRSDARDGAVGGANDNNYVGPDDGVRIGLSPSEGDVEVDGVTPPSKDLDISDKQSDCGDEPPMTRLDDDVGPEREHQRRRGILGNSDMEMVSLAEAGKSNTSPESFQDEGRNGKARAVKEFDPEPLGYEVTARRCIYLCICLFILLPLTNFVWIVVFGGGTIGAIFAFYALVGIGIAAPLPSTRWMRFAFMTVIHRAAELLNPRWSCLGGELRPIPFVDVFFADAMCSLSKLFFDWGMLFHLASHYPDPVLPSVHAIVIPSACASLPYLIRARQCLIMHTVGRRKSDPKRYQHLLNAAKYSSSLFPLCVSAYQKTVGPVTAAEVDKVLIYLLVFNSLYCLGWDIVMDWGMMTSPEKVIAGSCLPRARGLTNGSATAGDQDWAHHCLRQGLRLGLLTSLAIVAADTALRFAWALRFYQHALFSSNDSFILFTQVMEAFRRAIWNLLRIEWENIKHTTAKKKASGRAYEEEEMPFIAPKSNSLDATSRSRGH